MSIDLARVNAEFGRDAPALVAWALGLGQRAIVTTNFRPFEAVILHLVTRVQPDVPVVWMDNGYNTEATYRYADEVTKQLGLNLKIYLPRRTRAHREAVEGPVPALDDPRHAAFTEEVKLEPFARALRETAPKVWFTALRATDSAVRAQLDPVSINPAGLIKFALGCAITEAEPSRIPRSRRIGEPEQHDATAGDRLPGRAVRRMRG
ncbi:MAG: phosphoadenosine phosphosulfate reductase family protein, partial [Curvibacter sp.]